MKIMICSLSTDLPEQIPLNLSAEIKTNTLKKSGFIGGLSFQFPQKIIDQSKNPFRITRDGYQLLYFISSKTENRVNPVTLLEAIRKESKADVITGEQIPLLFQVVKYTNVSWLTICNINGHVGEKDFFTVVNFLQKLCGKEALVRPIKMHILSINPSEYEHIPKIVYQEFKEQYEKISHQAGLTDYIELPELNETALLETESIILDEELPSVEKFIETFRGMKFNDQKEIFRQITKILDEKKGIKGYL